MLKSLQKHFSIWHSTVLDRRLLTEKTLALYHWKTKLRVWRAWRAAVWAGQKHREVGKAEQELRDENRQEDKKEKNSVVHDHSSQLSWSRVVTVLPFRVGIRRGLNDLVTLLKHQFMNLLLPESLGWLSQITRIT